MVDLFEWYDYFFFAAVLMVSFGIGAVFACIGGKNKTIGEFMTANGKLGILPVGMSLYMTINSGINVIGNAAEMYTQGVQMYWNTIGHGFALLLSALWFAPFFHRLQLLSYNEYIYKRYDSRAAQLLNSVLNIIRSLLFVGFCVFVPATALDAVTNIPLWGACLMLCAVGTIYTAVGGIRAVVWTDTFQGLMMFAGLIAITVLGVKEAGGMKEIWQTCKEWGRLEMDFNPKPLVRMSFWSTIVGNFFLGISFWGPSQFAVQRYCALSNPGKIKWALAIMIPLAPLLSTVTFIIGAAMFTYYINTGCDPMVSGILNNPNQLMPYFVNTGINKPVLPGLFAATMAAGALSSVSSSISSISLQIWQDFFEPFDRFKNMTSTQKAVLTKGLTVMFGGISIGMGIMIKHFPGHGLQVAQTLNTAATTPVVGMFFLAAFFPFSNYIGCIAAGIAGFVFHLAQGLGTSLIAPYALTKMTRTDQCLFNANLTELYEDKEGVNAFFRVGFEWILPLGIAVSLGVGLIVSALSGPVPASQVDPRYIIPMFDWACCCFPARCLRRLWCGVDFSKLDEVDEKTEDSSNSKMAILSEDLPPISKDKYEDNFAFTSNISVVGTYKQTDDNPKLDWSEKSDFVHF